MRKHLRCSAVLMVTIATWLANAMARAQDPRAPISIPLLGAESMAGPSTATGSPASGPYIGATLSACEAAAEVNLGAWCDTRRLGDNTHRYTIDTAQSIGQALQYPANTNHAHWELPVQALWYVNIPKSTNTTDAFTLHDGSTFDGQTTSGVGNQMRILGTPGTAMRSLVSTDRSIAQRTQPLQSYIRAGGFYLGDNGATIATVLNWSELYDGSHLHNVSATNATGTTALFADICCHSDAENLSLSSNETASGGLPLGIHAVTDFTFNGMTVNDPGINFPNLSTNPAAPANRFLNVNGTLNGNQVYLTLYTERNSPPCSATAKTGCNSHAIFDNTGSWISGAAPKMIGGRCDDHAGTACFSNPSQPFLVSLGWRYGNNTINGLSTDNFGFHDANANLTEPVPRRTGQVGAGSVTFTPKAEGYYRVYAGQVLTGWLDIGSAQAALGQDLLVFAHGGHYGSTPTLTMLNTGSDYGKKSQIVTRVALSTDGDTRDFLDLYVAEADIPITVNFFGQTMDKGSIVAAPVPGNGPLTAKPYAQLDIGTINTDMSRGFQAAGYTTGWERMAGTETQAVSIPSATNTDAGGLLRLNEQRQASYRFASWGNAHPICMAQDLATGGMAVPVYSGEGRDWAVQWTVAGGSPRDELNYMCDVRAR